MASGLITKVAIPLAVALIIGVTALAFTQFRVFVALAPYLTGIIGGFVLLSVLWVDGARRAFSAIDTPAARDLSTRWMDRLMNVVMVAGLAALYVFALWRIAGIVHTQQ